MSREVLEILEKMDKKELKTQLALQCAPLLTGIKLSNLLTVTKSNYCTYTLPDKTSYNIPAFS